MQRITPCMWFNTQAEEARDFYVAVFSNSRTGAMVRYGDAGPGPKGAVVTAAFEFDGYVTVALEKRPVRTYTVQTRKAVR